MASTNAYPPGGTFLDTLKKSFTDAPVDTEKDNAVSTTEFLEAAESLTTLFGTTLTPISSTNTYNCGRCARISGIHARQERYAGQRQGSHSLPLISQQLTQRHQKIRDRQLAAPAESATLQDLVLNELKTKKHTATEGLVWLVR